MGLRCYLVVVMAGVAGGGDFTQLGRDADFVLFTADTQGHAGRSLRWSRRRSALCRQAKRLYATRSRLRRAPASSASVRVMGLTGGSCAHVF